MNLLLIKDWIGEVIGSFGRGRTAEGHGVARDGAGLDDGVLLAGEGAWRAGAAEAEAAERARPAAEREEGEQRGGDVHRGVEPRAEADLHLYDREDEAHEQRGHHAARGDLLAPRRDALRRARRRGLRLHVRRGGAGGRLLDLVRARRRRAVLLLHGGSGGGPGDRQLELRGRGRVLQRGGAAVSSFGHANQQIMPVWASSHVLVHWTWTAAKDASGWMMDRGWVGSNC